MLDFTKKNNNYIVCNKLKIRGSNLKKKKKKWHIFFKSVVLLEFLERYFPQTNFLLCSFSFAIKYFSL
jgi:hypothetical protein